MPSKSSLMKEQGTLTHLQFRAGVQFYTVKVTL